MWFELHPFIPGQPGVFEQAYCSFLARHPCVQMLKPEPLVPNSIGYPHADMLAEFGEYFFTSSIAWMLALAITKKPVEIGIFGVDMQGKDEYLDQRPGCHFFIHEARRRGIKVTAPPESDILRPSPQYGFCELDPKWVKLESKNREIRAKLAQAKHAAELHTAEAAFYEGAKNMLDYCRRTWG